MVLRELSELRTFLLLLISYGLISFLVVNPLDLPLLFQMMLTIPVLTLHSSLQHELIHGHPFTSQRLNDLLGMVPVGVFLCYFRFKVSHLKHHNNHIICDPLEDPESWYITQDSWRQKSKFMKKILKMNNTLLGRMLLGPTIGMGAFIINDMRNGPTQIRIGWLVHYTIASFYLWGVMIFGDIPLWAYLVCCYFALSMLMVRTFLEHQASTSILGRTVIIEKKGFFSFLFLNNNFHAVHHAYPNLAWYRIPALFERNKDRFLDRNKGYYFKSYGEIFARYLLKAKEPVAYPLGNGNSK